MYRWDFGARILAKDYTSTFGLVRRRCIAISVASATLDVFVWSLGRFAYGGSIRDFDVSILVIALAAGMLGIIYMVSEKNFWGNVMRGFFEPKEAASDTSEGTESHQPTVPRRIGLAPTVVITSVFFIAIVLDFVGIGRVINSTGGLLTSPFGQVPAIMLIVGSLQARKRRWKFILPSVGMIYFIQLIYGDAFGRATLPSNVLALIEGEMSRPVLDTSQRTKSALDVLIGTGRPAQVFLGLALVNLMISFGIQIYLNPRRAQ